MTKRKALQILIQAASNDIRGNGMGYRTTTEEWREQVKVAIAKLYKDAYGREMSYSDMFNIF